MRSVNEVRPPRSGDGSAAHLRLCVEPKRCVAACLSLRAGVIQSLINEWVSFGTIGCCNLILNLCTRIFRRRCLEALRSEYPDRPVARELVFQAWNPRTSANAARRNNLPLGVSAAHEPPKP